MSDNSVWCILHKVSRIIVTAGQNGAKTASALGAFLTVN